MQETYFFSIGLIFRLTLFSVYYFVAPSFVFSDEVFPNNGVESTPIKDESGDELLEDDDPPRPPELYYSFRSNSIYGLGNCYASESFLPDNYDGLFEMIQNRQYDEVIVLCKRRLNERVPWKAGDLTNFNDIYDGILFRFYMNDLASALELSGNRKTALRIYRALYKERITDDDYSWIEARLIYPKCRRTSFKLICEVGEKTYALLNIDQVYARNSIDRRYYDTRNYEMIMSATEWRRLYEIRDRCACIVCPDLHYRSTNGFNMSKLVKESYQKFLTFMEEEYAKPENNSEPGRYRVVMECFRKLGNLP